MALSVVQKIQVSCLKDTNMRRYIGPWTSSDIPSLSSIMGVVPFATPQTFSRIVVLPAFARPMTRMRKYGHLYRSLRILTSSTSASTKNQFDFSRVETLCRLTGCMWFSNLCHLCLHWCRRSTVEMEYEAEAQRTWVWLGRRAWGQGKEERAARSSQGITHHTDPGNSCPLSLSHRFWTNLVVSLAPNRLPCLTRLIVVHDGDKMACAIHMKWLVRQIPGSFRLRRTRTFTIRWAPLRAFHATRYHWHLLKVRMHSIFEGSDQTLVMPIRAYSCPGAQRSNLISDASEGTVIGRSDGRAYQGYALVLPRATRAISFVFTLPLRISPSM